MNIRNRTRGTLLARQACTARGSWSRLVGLLGRSSLAPGEGLVLDPCSSVHTAFMRFPIDVVYVDRSGRVVKLAPHLKPFRLSSVLRRACTVIELPAGTVAESRTAVGDELLFDP